MGIIYNSDAKHRHCSIAASCRTVPPKRNHAGRSICSNWYFYTWGRFPPWIFFSVSFSHALFVHLLFLSVVCRSVFENSFQASALRRVVSPLCVIFALNASGKFLGACLRLLSAGSEARTPKHTLILYAENEHDVPTGSFHFRRFPAHGNQCSVLFL